MSFEAHYQHHLDQVSRSFAYCIARLKAPLKPWVGLTYLICRILDTVEDASWGEKSHQILHFERFNQFLTSRPSERDVQLWAQGFPASLAPGERELLDQSFPLLCDLHNLPQRPQKVIRDMVLSMSNGMRYFVERQQETGQNLKLHSLHEVNQYCFFVAGVVGEALARLLGDVEPEFSQEKANLVDAFHFGLFLQKVNLLKDQNEDQMAGRDLIPCRNELKKSLVADARGAIRFLSSVPEHQREFRLFCAWSLFLGLASLPWIDRGLSENSAPKLPRDQAKELFDEVEKMIDDPEQLDEVFSGLLSSAGLQLSVSEEAISKEQNDGPSKAENGADSSWISKAYLGGLQSHQYLRLGV